MTIGKPSARSQTGELESAQLWVSTKYESSWAGEPLYESIFRFSSLDFSRLRILDVGSGPISVFEPFAPEDTRLVPFDTLAKEYDPLVPDKKFPIRGTLPDTEFDLVSILNCLDHMDEPEELLEATCERVAPEGRLWFFVNIDRPYEPELHPQDFKFWQLIAMMQRHMRIEDCGLVREGRLYPYAFWAICRPGRARVPNISGIRWNLKCALSYAYFHGVRAAVKLLRITGLGNLFPLPHSG